MRIKHILGSEHVTKKWDGGTTTQLYIYPENSNYTDRNFLFRISTATIETDESTFTILPEISRRLMILDGEIRIEHVGKYSKILKKFEQDEFSGDWETKSYGKATDFNLMTKGKTSGSIESIQLNQEQVITIEFTKNDNITLLYAFKGSFYLQNGKEKESIEKGDVYLINNNDCINAEIMSLSNSVIIICRIIL